jgi:hypothetical protein
MPNIPDPTSPIRHVIDVHRRWFHEFLMEVLAARVFATTADLLVVLADGLLVSPAKVASLTRDAVNRVLGTRY